MFKKLLCIVLASITLLVCLISCGGGDAPVVTDPITDPVTDPVTDAPDPSIVLVDDGGKTEYYIIVGKDAAKTVFSAANDLKGDMYNAFDTSFWVKRDDDVDARDTEILVGPSARAEATAATEKLEANTYSISTDGKKIIITGSNDVCVAYGVNKFIEKYIDGKSSLTKLLIENEVGEVPDGFEILNDGWNDMNDFPGTADIDIGYMIYKPANYDPEKKYPVLLFMHGNGSRGDDNSHIKQASASIIPTLTGSAQYKNEVIIIAPQCLKSEQWVICDHTVGEYTSKNIAQCLAEAVQVFDYWFQRISYDENRVYLWGNSMGAYASWDLMQRYPGKYAAAVIVAGCGDIAFAPQLAKNNIWIHHGDIDTTVPYSGNKKMYDALVANGAGDNVKFTDYPGKGHSIFTAVGQNMTVIDWMFAQTLKK
ncbi:MAG: prolyl oligopeptidase family serine peptidase [Clostridia bacterium]|nr:prolyl oligopeptidase family serine peptidase [Clostridia bacterium]